jgi:hypothetical protein
MSQVLIRLLTALPTLILASSAAAAQAGLQASSCTYERCALRVEAVPGSPDTPRLVQGIEAKPVETYGFLVPRIPLLESGPDSIRAPYRSFRAHIGASRWIFVAALGATIVEAASVATHPPAHAPNVLNALPEIGVDLGLGVAGLVEAKRGEDALQTAISRYNSALPDR